MHKFFDDYKQDEQGIPGLTMNRPMVENTLGSVGIEIEIEGRGLPRDGNLELVKGAKTGSVWTSVPDGSLRGESREYVLAKPCDYEEIPGMVNGLYGVFKTMSTELNLSNRTSTHVHCNMKGKTINLVTSAIALWVMFEDVIIPWCGEERTTNHFCLSTKDAPASLLPTWDQYLSRGNAQFDERGLLKYCALNIYPLFSKGSIEFRCGPRPDSAKQVIDFAKFCHNLVEYSSRYTNPQVIASDISEKGALVILREICSDMPGFFDEVLKIADEHPEAFDSRCMEGFRRAQSIVMGHPWDRWLLLIEKAYVPDPFRKARPAPRPPLRRNMPDPVDIDEEFAEELIRPRPPRARENAAEVERRFAEERVRIQEMANDIRRTQAVRTANGVNFAFDGLNWVNVAPVIPAER